jgi:hypothetical protein
MAFTISPIYGAGAQLFDNDGNPLSGGQVFTYAAGTSTPATTYTNPIGTIANSNPIIANAAGRLTNEIWLPVSGAYKFVLKDANGNLLATYDNIPTLPQPPIVNDASSISYEQGYTVNAGSFTVGANYLITSVGNTDFTAIGAAANLVGVLFTATGVGSGTGTAKYSRTVQTKLQEIVSAEDFGAIGNGVANDTAALQAAIDALQTGQTLNMNKVYKITSGLTITNKTRIRLTGNGRIFFSGASSSAYMFLMVGTIDQLEIDSLTLEGDGNSGYSQGAIGNNSGQTISNTRFHDLTIKNINVGISHNANLSGSYTNAWCYNNYLENISGTVAGSGYGIQAARAYNLHIYGNTLNNVSRHSVYVGRGQNLACLIEGNIFINHRKDVYDGSPRCAIDVGRVSGVTIANNTFRDCYDGQIYLGQDTSTGDDNSDILIIGNKFGTPKNAVPCIWLGEQLTPTTNTMYKIDVLDNTFEQDCSLTAATTILLLSGTQITVKNNRLRAYSVAATLPIFMELGDTRYITTDAHINDITVVDNVASSDKGSTVSGSRFLYIVDQLCTGSSRYTAKNNSCPTWAEEYYFEASPPTNLNSKFKFTKTITYTWNVAANTIGSGAFSIDGCKPTSSITVRPDSAAMTAPFLAIGGYAATSGPNAVEIYAVNANATTASLQVDMVHYLHIEDF